jgi:sulfate transport system ATP-binding protein
MISGVEKQFGRFAALKGVDLDIAPGELLALLGPSGSGKTTLLRIIAGLEFPDAGRVCFDADEVTFTHAAQRGVGFVFQQYALFKHMTVAKNVAFGLDVKARSQRPDRAARRARVAELLKLVELEGLADRYPAQLSGGQRQRVALARALAVSPRILLLDEPFGALDAIVRKTLRRELRRIHETTGLTTVFVTHDQEEALDLADRVALLNGGRIEQIGLPQTLIDQPASAFVAGFVGQSSRLKGQVNGGVFSAGAARLAAPDTPDGSAVAFVRPDQLAPTLETGLAVVVKRITPRGPLLWLDCVDETGQSLEAAIVRHGSAEPIPGEHIRLKLLGAHIFPDPK